MKDKEILGTYSMNNVLLQLCYDKIKNDFMIIRLMGNESYDILSSSLHDINTLDIKEPYYNHFKTIITSYKKTLKQNIKTPRGFKLELSGHRPNTTILLDTAIKELLIKNNIKISNYLQDAIIEKLQRDNLL